MYQENQEEVQGNSFPMEAFSPTLWLDMSIKSILLFAFMWIISRIIDKNIRFDNQNVTDGKREFISTTIVFLEVVVQIVVITIIMFIFKTIFRYLCDEYDLLSPELSTISWTGASFFIPFALFNMSTNLTDKLNYFPYISFQYNF